MSNLALYPRFRMMDREHCESIHFASLEILRHTGCQVFHEEALEILRQSNFVHIEGNRVRFQPSIVEWAIEKAPSRVPLCKRGSSEVYTLLEGRNVVFGTGSDCLTYLDPENGKRRPFLVSDLIDSYRVVDALDELQFCMSMGIPADINTNPYLLQFILMTEHTSKPIVFVCNDRSDCELIVNIASVIAGGIESLQLNPTVLLYAEPSSPLRHSETAVDKLLYMSEKFLPIVYSPAPVQGATAPATLGSALAMANAEILSGLVMHQLKREGAPFVYGCGMHHLDMKTMISVYTCPEFVLARTAVAEMGQYYGIPTWGYAGDSNSCVVDEQAAAEATFSIMAALLAGNNLTHDIGYLESGKTSSPEYAVLCDEIITMLRRYTEGFSIDQESLNLEVIHQVIPGNNFLDCDHTLKHYLDFWRPTIFNRLGEDAWNQGGMKKTGENLRSKTLSIIEDHKPEDLLQPAQEEIAYILKSRKKNREYELWRQASG